MLKTQKTLTLRSYLDSYQNLRHSKSSQHLSMQQMSQMQKTEVDLFHRVTQKLQHIKKQLLTDDINKLRTLTVRNILDVQSMLDTLFKKLKLIEQHFDANRLSCSRLNEPRHSLTKLAALRKCSVESDLPAVSQQQLLSQQHLNLKPSAMQLMIAPVMSKDIRLSDCTSIITLDQTPISSAHQTKGTNTLITTPMDQFFNSSVARRSNFSPEKDIYDRDDESIIYVITKPKT